MTDKKLFTEFPPTSTEQWESVIGVDLKGADYEKKLVWRTNEGFNVRPYYRAENLENLKYLECSPGQYPYTRGARQTDNRWSICQDFPVRNAKDANEQAVDAIKRGADAVGFSACGKGVKQEYDYASLLANIDFTKTAVHFDFGVNTLDAIKALPANARGTLMYDPLTRLAISGAYYNAKDFPMATVKELMEESKKRGNNYRVLGVDAAHFQNAGSTLSQELGLALAIASEYLQRLTDEGYSVAEVAKNLHFRFAVGSNYFMEIAKLRAARMLIANLFKAFDEKLADEAALMPFIHAETASWNTTIYDPNVNLLRTTTEAMSAAIAGVECLWVQTFDIALKKPENFAQRIARNQQIILRDEAHIDKIVDASAGSYYIENLTNSIAETAWKLFLDIDERGGYTEAMKAGYIQGIVAEASAKRLTAIASRKEILLGTNQYANTLEHQMDKLESAKCALSIDENAFVTTVPEFRLGAAFEELRLRTERSGRKPKVFLLTIGNLTMRKARAGFANNFFGVAGYEVIDNNGFESIAEGMKAAEAAKADIIVLCSSDDEYPALAPEAVAAAKGKGILVLAGYPKAILDELKAAGIENFIYAGQNVLEALTQYQEMLNIK